MRTSCPSCGTEVETDDGRWCPNPDCGAYISWDEQDETASEAESTRRPGEQDDPPPPPQDQTTVIPAVEPKVSCPACGTDNPQDRSLCQHCGSPLQAPPSPPPPEQPERRPSGIRTAWLVGGGVAIVLVGVLAFVLLGDDGDDGDDVTEPLAEVGATPTASAEPSAIAESPSPEESVAPSPTDEATPLATPTWVAILRSMDVDAFDEGDAEAHATSIADEVDADPGVLLSDDFGSLNPGYWVVYVGDFADRDAADDYCATVAEVVPDCYARLVE